MRPLAVAAVVLSMTAGCAGPAAHRGAALTASATGSGSFVLPRPRNASSIEPSPLRLAQSHSAAASSAHWSDALGSFTASGTEFGMVTDSVFELPPQPAIAGSVLDALSEPEPAAAPGMISAHDSAAPASNDDQLHNANRIAEAGFLAPAAALFLAAVLVIPLGCSFGAALMFPRQRDAPARASPPHWLDVRIKRPVAQFPAA